MKNSCDEFTPPPISGDCCSDSENRMGNIQTVIQIPFSEMSKAVGFTVDDTMEIIFEHANVDFIKIKVHKGYMENGIKIYHFGKIPMNKLIIKQC